MPSLPTILVIEHDLDIVHAVQRRLERAGYQVVTSADGSEGISVALEVQPRAIVLGDSVLRISNVSILRLLNDHPHTEHIPIVLIVDSDDFQWQGAFAKLTKPYEGTELQRTVALAVKAAKGYRQARHTRIEAAHIDTNRRLRLRPRLSSPVKNHG